MPEKKNDRYYRDLVENLSDWVWEVDGNAVYTYVSPKVRDFLGYEPEEVVGRTPFDLMPPAEAERVAAIFGPIAAAQKPFENLENVNLHKDGHEVILETSGIPIFSDDGTFTGYRGIDRDLTRNRRAETLLKEALEALPQGFSIFDPDDRLIACNEAYKTIYEASRDLFVPGASFEEMVHKAASRGQYRIEPAERDAWIRERIHRHQNPDGVPFEQVLDDGRWLQITEHRTPTGYLISNRTDVTPLKNTQEALRESARLLDLFFSDSMTCFALLDPDFNFIRVNDAYAKAGARSVEEFIGKNHFDLYPSNARAIFEKVLATKTPYESFARPFEYADHPEWGTSYWDIKIQPILDDDDEVEMLALSLNNVTAREKAEQEVREANRELERRVEERTKELRESEAETAQTRQRLIDAIESISEAFVLYDANDRLILCNNKYREFYPKTAPAIMEGATFEELVDAYIASGENADALADPAGWKRQRLEEHQKSKGNTIQRLTDGRWLQVSERRTGEGGTVSIRTDITEQKQVEMALSAAKTQLEVANRAKSEFLATMSHELRTPLNAIIGFSDYIRQEIGGPVGNNRYRGYLDDIHDSGQHLLTLINDILDVSAIEANALELHEERIALQKTLDASIRLMGPRAEKQGVNIVSDVSADLPDIFGDGRRLRQVLLNLLSNAVKFSDAGGEIKVSTRQETDGSLVVSIADQGAGMDAMEIEKAKEPFGRVGTRQTEGTGLGLPLSLALMELHGGTITIESEKGVGTTVTTRLPVGRVLPQDGP
ncbi:MAG: PAS-domain containing protein [Rhodospirillales bacterium]|nr:PAS-domain containing protein [Rhodospirillales bacterium]MCW8861360.1 PAS-domain containing protein [Rhodospirillales bacterium]MCW8952647.1 PAS-domain containing protein [Rhodospirillales bacterium]MCW9001168.1 PAS-domain containing protein [Rhodospirillales bacterium]